MFPARCREEEPIQWRDDAQEGEKWGKVCPVYLRRDFEELFFAWSLFDSKGLLPHAGTWAQQPADLIHAFQVISAAVAKMHEDARANADDPAEG